MLKDPVKDHFDLIAKQYDYYKEKNKFYYENLKILISDLVDKNSKVVEIGCGTGDILAHIDPDTGVGIDLSPQMIKLASRKNHQKNLHFTCKPITHFKNKKIDYIYMCDVVEHLTYPQQMFDDISQVMTPKTKFVCTMANPIWEPFLMIAEKLKLKMPEGPHYRWSTKQMIAFLEKSGLKVSKHDYKLLCPIHIPLLTQFLNRYFEKYFKTYAFIEYFICTK